MANIKSQIKRNRQNDKRRLRNRVYRGTARIAVRGARSAIEAGVPESKAALLSAISALDKAAEQGVLHKNNAARRKSRLMKAFGKMEPAAIPAESGMLEPVAEAVKAAPRKRNAKAEAAEDKKALVTSSPKGKKTAAKKAPATSSPKGKKTASKKPAAKK